eukprot:Hpha_TRINITY_DN15719_c1_g1::TRINITY_DN15719_c1_g1_i1::g.36746::m.36746
MADVATGRSGGRRNQGKGGRAAGARARVGGGSKDELVIAIKTLQRSGDHWRLAWGAYCDAHGQGVRDPVKHHEGWLRQALAAISDGTGPRHAGGSRQGTRFAPGQGKTRVFPAGGGGGYGGGGGGGRGGGFQGMVEQVKHRQRSDPQWHNAWGNYCRANGQGICDPNRHTEDYLRKALRTLGPAQGGVGQGFGGQGFLPHAGGGPAPIAQLPLQQQALLMMMLAQQQGGQFGAPQLPVGLSRPGSRGPRPGPFVGGSRGRNQFVGGSRGRNQFVGGSRGRTQPHRSRGGYNGYGSVNVGGMQNRPRSRGGTRQ